MFTFGFDPELYIAARRNELLQEAQKHRLVQEALKSRQSQPGRFAKLLVSFGRRLIDLGAGLEERYGAQQQAALQLKH
ncbi:MAG TPA: hypothetical protein VLA49_06350 [Anaerolineales bacterium]|nr:hypothetical protein [Anaerolineales bacterium]